MEPLQFVAWVIVHIAVPIFAPIALLPLLRLGRTFRLSARGILRDAVKNGQLLWTVIAMSAGGCYELAGYLTHASPAGQHLAWVGLSFYIFIITISAALVLVGVIDGIEESKALEGVPPSRIMVVSFALTGASVVLYAAAHFFITN